MTVVTPEISEICEVCKIFKIDTKSQIGNTDDAQMITYWDLNGQKIPDNFLQEIGKIDLNTSNLYIIVDDLKLTSSQLSPVVENSFQQDLVPPQQSYEAFGNFNKVYEDSVSSLIVLESDLSNMRDAQLPNKILMDDYS